MATPTIAAVRSLGYVTNVLVQSNCRGAETILDGWEAVNYVYGTVPAARHNAVVRTWWHRGADLGLGPECHPDHCDIGTTHEVVANLSAARALGYAGPVPETHVEGDAARRLAKAYVVVAPGWGAHDRGFWLRKSWPRWSELVRMLNATGRLVVVLGSAEDASIEIAADVLDLRGQTTVRQAVGWLRGAVAAVCVDNGLAHVSAAAGTPTVALFGATSEIKNRPAGRDVTVVAADIGCRPCQMTERWESCRGAACMEAIGAEAVLDAVQQGTRRREGRG